MASVYSTIRKIHLYTGFVVAAFLLLFFLTGGVMIMEHIFPRENLSQKSNTVNKDPSLSQNDFLKKIKTDYDLRGIEDKEERDSLVIYTFERPGFYARVRLNTVTYRAEVTRMYGTFSTVMNYYHRIRGFDRGIVHIAWAILYDLASLALLGFAFSGMYLWWKLIPNKTIGWICFAISTGLTLFMILYVLAVG